jgi:cephalosporin hydroxylase
LTDDWLEDLAAGYPRAADLAPRARDIVNDYHRLYYNTERHAQTRWFGHEVWKYPTDLLMYVEAVHDLRPAVIVESGAYRGGSALFFAHLCQLADHGRVLSIDVRDWGLDERGQPLPTHPRLTYLLREGGSTDPAVVAEVAAFINGDAPVMVVLDSDHTADHVYAELEAYGPLVTSGSLLVVEDTNLGGNPVLPGWGPSPADAVAKWLPEHPEFNRDPSFERLLLTANPGGWLKKS